MPEMIFVTSSNIEAIGYENASSELYVRFLKSGETYVYENVPEHVHTDFMQADSKGSYLAREVKGRYTFHKL